MMGSDMEDAGKGSPDPMGVELEQEDSRTRTICRILSMALYGFWVLMACLILFAWLNN